MPKRHVLVVEPDGHGHRLGYARIIATDAPGDTRVTVALSADPSVDDLVGLHLADLPPTTLERTDLADWSTVRSFVTQRSPDLALFPDGDRYLVQYLLRGLGTTPARFLLLRDPGSIRPLWRRWLKELLVWSARTVRRAEIAVLVPAFGQHRTRLPQVADPIDVTRGTARPPIELERGRTWFGILGAVSERKNPTLVARAMLDSPRLLADAGLVVAGQISPNVMEDLADLRHEHHGLALLVLDRLLTEQELNYLVDRVDCVVIAHDNEGPSGVFGKAAALGTGVVAAGAASLREDAAAWPRGARWCALNRSALRAALEAELARTSEPGRLAVCTPVDFARRMLDPSPWRPSS